GAARDRAVDGGGEVGGPVGQQVGELVQPEQDRRGGEARAQDQVGLVGGVLAGGGSGDTGCGGGHADSSLSIKYPCYRASKGWLSRFVCFRMEACTPPTSISSSPASPAWATPPAAPSI